ncbi:organic solvent tolerance protein [Sphingomonas sp. Leaf407]|uniref:LPS-assembly protein LptD n=1 Tax=unclassified Sphingomonas TaxID=196159 RepID=UPI0006F36B5F|nr:MULTISPECIES: LPS assembly protein LptD [unclassified Sphingomonas]KQN36860.1 organic solvent tolerance protein [Sphingomonas sp. Leaf42]KQT30287.1 organic solvent tolerance protein [Sphingomonas sp. Leaf407]
MKRAFGSLALGLTLAVAGPALAQDLQDRAAPPPPPESALPTPASADQIDFSSDLLEYDSNADIVTASGEVRLLRDGNRLRADRVTWNRKSGQVVATGNIAVTNPQGDIAYGDRIELTDTLKDGVVDNMLVVLDEGGRIAARRGTRSDNGVVTVESAAYTPCAVTTSAGCPKEPSWKITALRVRYDPVRQRIRYTGAGLTLFGLPTIPLPSFSHSIGGNSDSGLLAPSIRLDRVNGVEVAVPYYFNLARNRDLTITPHVFTAVLPMLEAEYRALGRNGAYRVQGFATVSRRSDDLVLGAAPTGTQQSFRGYVDATGRFQLDPNWSVSGSLRYTTDQTFLRRYDISRDDRLRNNISVERIDRDSMLSISGWAVQTLRVGDNQGMQPVALPEIDYRRRFNGLLGGVAQVQLNTLAIGRSEGQDTQRAFAAARWDLTRYTPLGQEVTFTAYGRLDAYNTRDVIDTAVLSYRGGEGFTPRGIAALAVDMRWPFVGAVGRGTQRISPRVQLVASPKIANLAVPNEDARAVDLEDSNLFALNRFAGYDRFEDSSRVTYGLDYALDLPGVAVQTTIGQSYRTSERASILPNGTGLDDRFSDFVGRTDVRFRELVTLTHRYRLDKDGFKIRRNEIDATVGSRRTYVQVGYLRLNRDISELEDLQDREEIRAAGRVAFGPFWSAFASTTIDLTDRSEDALSVSDGYDPIRHRIGAQYEDDCLRLGLTWKRDYQRIGDARSGNSYLVTLAFKNLGR